MKHLVTSSIVLCLPVMAVAQSTDRNFVKETLCLDSAGTGITSVVYYDGAGNPVETARPSSGSGGTLHTRTAYDGRGHARRVYCPVPVSGGLEYMGAQAFVSASSGFYNDTRAYAQYAYDHDGRIVRACNAGKPWHEHGAAEICSYGTNAASDAVIGCSVEVTGAYYPHGTLDRQTATDADGRQTTTFTNLAGNIVLERRDGGDTYYSYDRLGQLTAVYQPEAQNGNDVDAYAYRYEYDRHGNISKKTLPGAECTRYWYDREGLLAFEQDARLREKGLYRFYLYDDFLRIVIVGTCTRCNTNVQYAAMKVKITYLDGLFGTKYSLCEPWCMDMDGASMERIYFYDSYNKIDNLHYWKQLKRIKPQKHGPANGLVTASIVAASDGQHTFNVYTYDNRGNITTVSTLGLDGYMCRTTYTYSLTGRLTSARVEADINVGAPFKATEDNTYSMSDDLPTAKTVTIAHGSVTAEPATIGYTHDAFGRLAKVSRTGNAGDVAYAYDMHGWPVSIESPGFGECMYYADGAGTPCYNGDISTMTWRDADGTKRGYRFFYDGMDRLVAAKYGEGEDLGDNEGRFDEYVEYDLNGNITALDRYGRRQDGTYGDIDRLAASLSGNHVFEVTDRADRIVDEGAVDFDTPYGKAVYTYDGCGALTGDTGRGIANIKYDNSGNPLRIQFMDGSVTGYVYTADGEKLRTVHYTAMRGITVPPGMTVELDSGMVQAADTIDYLLNGNLVLKNGRIERYLFDGGYYGADAGTVCVVPPPTPSWLGTGKEPTQEQIDEYERQMTAWREASQTLQNTEAYSLYFYDRDHTGNNRAVTDTSGKILQMTNYYPYGLPFCDTTAGNGAGVQPYKYNGKELDLMHGLNTYDYGARQYYPALPVWDRMDNMCEEYSHLSPYCYCMCNPINIVDPNGMKIVFVNGFIGCGSYPSGDPYWGGLNSSFVDGAKSFFHDNNVLFPATDYTWGSSADLRTFDGFNYAKEHFGVLTSGIKENETFKFVSHSMGAAFAEGMALFLDMKGYDVEQIVHINAFQANDIVTMTPNSNKTITTDYQNTDDYVINYTPFVSSPGNIHGSKYIIREASNEIWKYIHTSPISAQGSEFWKNLRSKQLDIPLVDSPVKYNINIP